MPEADINYNAYRRAEFDRLRSLPQVPDYRISLTDNSKSDAAV
jgi:hypothetical protein